MRIKKKLFGTITVLSLMIGYSFADVHPIANCDDLAAVNEDLTENYTLTQDIDCSGSGNSIMIGTSGNPFVGEFDGQGKSIVLNINSTEKYIGLFRNTNGAIISNLIVSGSVVSSFQEFPFSAEVGGVVGSATNSHFDNTHFSGIVSGAFNNIGGLIGHTISNTSINNSSSSVFVDASGAIAGNVGGLIGRSDDTTISGSYAVGNLHGTLRIGGLVGVGVNTIVNQSYAAVDVDSDYAAGGLFGRSFSSSITDSYAKGYVHVRDGEAAGLIGFVDSTSMVHTYAVGNITGTTYDFGGLVGNSQGGSNSAAASFWDTETSGMPSSLFGEGKTTNEMENMNTFTGWDFESIWGLSGSLNDGYPYLLAIPPTIPGDTTAPETIIISASADFISSSNVTFEFVSNEQPVTFECSLDDGIVVENYVACTSPYTRTNLTPGTYILRVRAKDAADNIDLSPVEKEWTVSNLHVITVSPTQGTTNVPVNGTIVVEFSEPVTGDLSVSVGSSPCDGSGGSCPQLDGVWSSGNTVVTYTRADENFHYNTTYTISIHGLNGLNTIENPLLARWSFTMAAAASHGGGGGGGGGIIKDKCSEDNSASYYDKSCGDIVSGWKKFFATFSSGAISTVSDPITVKAFVTDVFTLLHITKPIHRQADSYITPVPESFITKVIQILRKILSK